ncbi:hypothetical protein K438DRAFT_1964030 [Mycena galopus ATCC 62051]|nr:hypothetical protein K438DRAFT_1964030 [Mycena galopus ATCC 62051]
MSALLNPLKLESTTIPSRVGMSALTRNRATATVPNEIMLKYYVQHAKGGAGLIVTEGVLIMRQGSELPEAPRFGKKFKSKAGRKSLTPFMRPEAKYTLRFLWHLGRLSHPDAPQQITAGVPGPLQFQPAVENSASLLESLDMLRQPKSRNSNRLLSTRRRLVSMALNCMERKVTLYTNSSTPPPTPAPTNRTRLALEILKELVAVWGPIHGHELDHRPDVGRHLKAGKPLESPPDFMALYGVEGVDPALGYTDHKEATY